MGALPLMHDERAFGYVAAECVPDPSRGWLAVSADHDIGVLEGVYVDRYAELLGEKAALPHLVVSVREVRIDDVGLTDPDPLLKDDPVLVAIPR